ncbi:MAG: serine--tRNA ligase [Nitriliruptorales bacterium]|nr:serine--tRNA ligase [Nitriliruptorales bacterium]
MIDIRLVREHFERTATALARRGVPRETLDTVRELDERRRELITSGDELRARQRALGRQIGAARDPADRQTLIEETRGISAKLSEIEPAQSDVEQRLERTLAVIPNLGHPDAPEGLKEEDAVEVGRFGQMPEFDFEVRDHLEIGEAHGLIDIARAVKVSGSRFAYLTGQAVFLELALVRWALDRLATAGFTPVIPPVLNRQEALYGTAFLPTGEDQLYRIGNTEQDEPDLYLVGTSEVPLAGLHMDEILAADALPLRYAGFSPCFRREAGTYGKDTRGIFRVHQFDKVEMFSFTLPEHSWEEHERLLELQVDLLGLLGLHGRVVDIAVGDLGASAARKYDLEVWLPGQQAYRELTSASNCTDYQARRLRCRYRTAAGDTEVVHTLNGTAIAVGRTIIALLETHQRADGTVTVPETLVQYLGAEVIGKAG